MDERLIKELKVLRLQPGETLVIEADRRLSREECEQIMATAKMAGIKAVVLDGSLKAAAVQS